MKILHRYILKMFIGPFVMTFAIVVFALLMQFLFKWVDELVGKGLSMGVILQLLAYASAGLATMAFPLAILLASIMTLGNLGERYELIAMKSAGISLQRIVRPLIFASVGISVCAFLFANYITPYTNLQMRDLLNSIRETKHELLIREGVFFSDIEGYSIRIGKKDYQSDLLYNIQIYDHTEDAGNVSVTLADSGYMRFSENKKYLEVTLFHCTTYSDVLDNRGQISTRNFPFRRDQVDTQIMRLALSDFGLKKTDNSFLKQGHQMMNIAQLSRSADSLIFDLGDRAYYLKRVLTQRFEYFLSNSKTYIPPDDMPQTVMDGYNMLSQQDKEKAIETALYNASSVVRDASNLKPVLQEQMNMIRRYQIEWHTKYSLSFACLIFFFVGAPLGAIIRKGGLGTPVIVAVMFFILFYVVMIIGRKSAQQGVILPWEGIWLAPAVVLPIGVFLTYQATRDSTLMTADLYRNFFKKIAYWLFPQPISASLSSKRADYPRDLQALRESLRNMNGDILRYLRTRISKAPLYHEIWITEPDKELVVLSEQYASLHGALQQIDHPSVWEQLLRGSGVSFEQPGIPKNEHWKKTLYTLMFPLGLYLWIKVVIQRARLRMVLLDLIKQNHTLASVLSGIILEEEVFE